MQRAEKYNDQLESLMQVMDSHQSGMWTALPAEVTAVDLEAQTISAQPLIKAIVVNKDNTRKSVALPILADVPICFPRAGNFVCTLPVKVGDEVLIVFASRCINAWWQNGGVSEQEEFRMHDLSDGFAILAPTSQAKKVHNVSTSNLQVRTLNGAMTIDISDNKINVSGADVAFNGNVNISGTLTVAGIDMNTHLHGGVRGGPDNTGQPIN